MSATYGVAEAAALLGISKGLAYQLIREDTFPSPIIRLGRVIRVAKAPLDRLVETGEHHLDKATS